MISKFRFSCLGIVAAAGITMNVGMVAGAPLPPGWTCDGNCGTNTTADGVVTLVPGFSSYQWISTDGGSSGLGTLPVGPTGAETDGSFAQTTNFSVNAGDELNFYFNYITSDGAEFTEYAWAGLYLGSSTFDSYLFTARTTTSGDTVPGFGLPGLGTGVALTPSSTAIIPGGPTFSPLGGNSGSCYNTGCGYTGWIQMNYEFTTAGLYSLGFGVTNALDTAYDSAFAVAGVAVNDVPIDPPDSSVPEPSTLVLFGLGMAGLAGWRRLR